MSQTQQLTTVASQYKPLSPSNKNLLGMYIHIGKITASWPVQEPIKNITGVELCFTHLKHSDRLK